MRSVTVWFWLAAASSLLVASASYRFVFSDIETAFEPIAGHHAPRDLAFLLHVVAAPLALAMGVAQFLPRLRARFPGLHRSLGWGYGLAVLVGGGSAIAIGVNALGGAVASWGFTLLAVAWLGTTAQALRMAAARRFEAHRRWISRSYALCFAAVSLRLQLPGLFAAGLDYAEASRIVAWSCWLPNLLIVEALLRRGRPVALQSV